MRAKKSDSKLVAIACSCNIITRINILVEIFEKVKVKIIFYGNGKVMEFVERVRSQGKVIEFCEDYK